MLLCDSATVAEGKLFILGGGWTVVGPQPTPMAIALKLDVAWTELDDPHHWELFLEDADGQEVVFDTPEGPRPVEVRGDFQVGRPPGAIEGAPVSVNLAVNIGPLPFNPGQRFNWKLVVDGQSEENWALSFSTRSLEEGDPGEIPGVQQI